MYALGESDTHTHTHIHMLLVCFVAVHITGPRAARGCNLLFIKVAFVCVCVCVYAGIVMLQLLTAQDARRVIQTVEEARKNPLHFAYVSKHRHMHTHTHTHTE